jgi:hypothetical protein
VRGRSPPKLPFPEGSDLFSLFQISLVNYFDIKFRLWREHGIDPVFLENLPFYEYQLWIEKINQSIEIESQEDMESKGFKQVFSLKK